jgi:UTP--glucose-1-phosphate uridylyltransferase
MTKRVRKAVFPVAGLGTRFLPATKAMPKEMLPIVDKPLIQYAIEEAKASGIEEFILVTGRGKTIMEDHFDHPYEMEATLEGRGKRAELETIRSFVPKAGEVVYTRQQRPLGLGHAVWCARHLVGDEPFAVMLPDDLIMARTPCLRQLIDVHEGSGGSVVAVMEVPREHTKRYGVLDPKSDDGRLVGVKGLVEKPDPSEAPSNLSIIGRYVLTPEVFDILSRTERGAGNEIQLTDALVELIGTGQPFHGLRFEGTRFDCGDKVGFLEATVAFALARPDTQSEMRRILQSHR